MNFKMVPPCKVNRTTMIQTRKWDHLELNRDSAAITVSILEKEKVNRGKTGVAVEGIISVARASEVLK